MTPNCDYAIAASPARSALSAEVRRPLEDTRAGSSQWPEPFRGLAVSFLKIGPSLASNFADFPVRCFSRDCHAAKVCEQEPYFSPRQHRSAPPKKPLRLLGFCSCRLPARNQGARHAFTVSAIRPQLGHWSFFCGGARFSRERSDQLRHQ
jgi:hypothetical protein